MSSKAARCRALEGANGCKCPAQRSTCFSSFNLHHGLIREVVWLDPFSRWGNKVSQRLRDSPRVTWLLRGGAWTPTWVWLTADPSLWPPWFTGSLHKGKLSFFLAMNQFTPGWMVLFWMVGAYISGPDSVHSSSWQLCLQRRIWRGWKPLCRPGPLLGINPRGLQPQCECGWSACISRLPGFLGNPERRPAKRQCLMAFHCMKHICLNLVF